MGSTGIFLNGGEIGRVNWSYDGNKATLWANCPYEGQYIYRLNIMAGAEKIALGVMMPRGDLFTIKTTLSPSQYKLLLQGQSAIRAEIWRNIPGEICATPLPFALSELDDIPEGFGVQDKLFNTQIHCKGKILYKHCKQRTYIVFDIKIGKEMLFLPFFCFITPVLVGGEAYGAICLDERENFLPIVQ